MLTRTAILKALADGAFHSGTEIGRRLGVSRAAVCKSIRALTQAGLEIQRVTGRGYRMAAPAAPLERRAIARALARAGVPALALTILEQVDSTSRYLLAQAPGGARVCLAEAQPQGRGRRGRAWIATPYHNLMLSMDWQFAGGPATLAGLSLAAGLAVLRALERYGARELALKWPNDVLHERRKLAGLLVDVQGEAAGPTRVVVGVGINGYIGARDAARIDQPWVDLQRLTGAAVDRNRLAALAIGELYYMFETFATDGFAPFRLEWQRRHHYHAQRVRLLTERGDVSGTVVGVDAAGALLLRDAAGACQAFHAGQISLRPE